MMSWTKNMTSSVSMTWEILSVDCVVKEKGFLLKPLSSE